MTIKEELLRNSEGASKATSPSLVEPITVYRACHTDGYTHFYSGPLCRTYAEAAAIGAKEFGAYAREPVAFQAIERGDGSAWLVEGGPPLMFVEAVELAEALRQQALAKLTPQERKVLGL